MKTDTDRQGAIQPLTKIYKKTGNPCTRHPDVEAEIKAVLHWPLHDAFSLASQNKLRPQTLVYLLRHFRPNRSTPEYDSLIVAFFSRLERTGDSLVRNFTEVDRERIHDEVKDRVLQWWDTEAMDAFEMSFKKVAERLYFTAIDKVGLRIRTVVSWENMVDPGSDQSGEDVANALGLANSGSAMPLAEAKVALAQLIGLLSDNEKLAVEYVKVLGYTEKEAGDLMGCTDRNVRYLLKKAHDKAQDMKKKGARVARVET